MELDATKKKAIIFGVIFVVIAGLVIGLANLIGYLTKPNNHNETRYGVYRIRMSGWEGSQGAMFRQWARETLPELNRLGPTHVLLEDNDSQQEDISVLRVSVVDNVTQCPQMAALAFQTDTLSGRRRIIIDPVCTQGELQFKSAFMHEIGHSLGMGHVCNARDNRTDCSPVGRGDAVMNPNLLNEAPRVDPFHTVDVGDLPTWEIQELDIKEFCRVRGCGNSNR